MANIRVFAELSVLFVCGSTVAELSLDAGLEASKTHQNVPVCPKVVVSVGELVDKIIILRIKAEEIKDKKKLLHIMDELSLLEHELRVLLCPEDQELCKQYVCLEKELHAINKALWDIEDQIRICEKIAKFDHEFIELARSVYITNDQRSRVKKAINELFSSQLVEEKSYV